MNSSLFKHIQPDDLNRSHLMSPPTRSPESTFNAEAYAQFGHSFSQIASHSPQEEADQPVDQFSAPLGLLKPLLEPTGVAERKRMDAEARQKTQEHFIEHGTLPKEELFLKDPRYAQAVQSEGDRIYHESMTDNAARQIGERDLMRRTQESAKWEGENKFLETQKTERGKERDEAEALGSVSRTLNGAKPASMPSEITPLDARIGVSFRTDSVGKAHTDWDKKSLSATTGSKASGVNSVVPETLPHGATGGATPNRQLTPGNLTGQPGDFTNIDGLYIPGAPVAPDSQRAATRSTTPDADKDVQRTSPQSVGVLGIAASNLEAEVTQAQQELKTLQEQHIKDALPPTKKAANIESAARKAAVKEAEEKIKKAQLLHGNAVKKTATEQRTLTEHQSRSPYELDLIREGRRRGMPMMAICAGSWRLLEAFGGEAETLPTGEREEHRNTGPGGVWGLNHDVDVVPNTLLDSMVPNSLGTDTHIPNANSTHWAVAAEDNTGKLAKRENQSGIKRTRDSNDPANKNTNDPDLDPNDVLEVSARSSTRNGGQTALTRSTVEAVSSKHGAPVLGLQWHPEGYLPGMDGRSAPTEGTPQPKRETTAEELFAGFAQSAVTYRRKQAMLAELKSLHKGRAEDEGK